MDDQRPDPRHHDPRRRGRQDKLILFFCRGFILESLLAGSRRGFPTISAPAETAAPRIETGSESDVTARPVRSAV